MVHLDTGYFQIGKHQSSTQCHSIREQRCRIPLVAHHQARALDTFAVPEERASDQLRTWDIQQGPSDTQPGPEDNPQLGSSREAADTQRAGMELRVSLAPESVTVALQWLGADGVARSPGCLAGRASAGGMAVLADVAEDMSWEARFPLGKRSFAAVADAWG